MNYDSLNDKAACDKQSITISDSKKITMSIYIINQSWIFKLMSTATVDVTATASTANKTWTFIEK